MYTSVRKLMSKIKFSVCVAIRYAQLRLLYNFVYDLVWRIAGLPFDEVFNRIRCGLLIDNFLFIR